MLRRAYTSEFSLCHCPLCEDVYQFFYPDLSFSSCNEPCPSLETRGPRSRSRIRWRQQYKRHSSNSPKRWAPISQSTQRTILTPPNGLIIKGVAFDLPVTAWEQNSQHPQKEKLSQEHLHPFDPRRLATIMSYPNDQGIYQKWIVKMLSQQGIKDIEGQQISYETFVNTVTLKDRGHCHFSEVPDRPPMGVVPCARCLARMGRSDAAADAIQAKRQMIEDAADKWRIRIEMMKEKKLEEQRRLEELKKQTPQPQPKPKPVQPKQKFQPRKTFPRQPSPPPQPPKKEPKRIKQEPKPIDIPIPIPTVQQSPTPPPHIPTPPPPVLPTPSPTPPPREPTPPPPPPPPRSPTPKLPTPEPVIEPKVIQVPTPEPVMEEIEEVEQQIEEEEPKLPSPEPDPPREPTPPPIIEPSPPPVRTPTPPAAPTPAPSLPVPTPPPPEPQEAPMLPPLTPEKEKTPAKPPNKSNDKQGLRWRADTVLIPIGQQKGPQKDASGAKGKKELPPVKKPPKEKKKKAEPPAPQPSKKKKKKGKGKKTPTLSAEPTITIEPPPPESPAPEPEEELQNEEPVVEPPPPPVKAPKEKKKRVRWRAKKEEKVVHEIVEEKLPSPDLPEPPQAERKSIGDWIYDHADFSTTLPDTPVPSPSPLPSIMSTLSASPVPSEAPVTSFTPDDSRGMQKQLPNWEKRRWGVKKKDFDYEEDRRREMLAEERKLKAQQMMEKIKGKRLFDSDAFDGDADDDFNEYGWLAKYCILKGEHLNLYKHAFEALDEEGNGRLSCIETMLALRSINKNMSDTEEEYIYRMLDLVGYKITEGSDFRLFAILCALSHRITSLESWMRCMLQKLDMRHLSQRVFKCKDLWECNVDNDTRTISIDQLCVELRAGGVSYEHECEVRDVLGAKLSLDLLDFITYIPLFIMIHNSVVCNPLNDTRDK